MIYNGGSKENLKEGETVSGKKENWYFYLSSFPANTGKHSCKYDISLHDKKYLLPS